MDLVARDAHGAGLGSFQTTLLHDAAWLTAGTPTNCCPASTSTILPVSGDSADGDSNADGDPATGDAFIACSIGGAGPTGDVVLATVPFTITGPGESNLDVFRVRAADALAFQPVSCDPVDLGEAGAGCLNGAVTNSS